MSKAAPPSPSNAPVDAAEVRQSLAGKHVCPFCGVLRADAAQPCPRCTLEDSAATRSATKQRIGPWFVLQARNPSAPGMKLATLQSLVRRGHLTPRSVVRGPTTDQMWAFVATVRGLSREFGLCYHCGEAIEPTVVACPHCNRGQELPPDPDALLESDIPPATPAPAPTPVTPPAVSPLFSPPPTPPSDFLAAGPLIRTDTGMDGGTSLDLQADSLFPLSKSNTAPRPAPVARPMTVQRAPAPGKEEAILSARELAAAFQLDFRPPGSRNVSPRRPVRTLAVLLLIALVAAAIVLGLRDDWRRTTFDWTLQQWARLAASLEQPAKPPASLPPTPPTVAAVPPAMPAVRDVPKPALLPLPTPATSTPATPTPAAPHVDPAPAPRPAPPVVVAPTPAPVAPPTPAADDLSIEQATTLASDLRLKAIDAQARNDWPAALKYYEQIERLPRDAWPADLPMRLDVAKRRVAAP